MPLPDELLAPIEGDAPAGVSIRYEPVFDQIKVARIEEVDVPQGDWVRERKTADYPLVIKLSTNVLATQSKDLQIAAWLTEALLQTDGFGGLNDGLILCKGLIESFWDDLFPELEDGDAEFRAAPLEWLGKYLAMPARMSPLNREGHGLALYRQSRLLPTEAEGDDDRDKEKVRQQAAEEGKLLPEEFDKAFAGTPKPWYKKLVADLDASQASLKALDDSATELFGDVAPSFLDLRGALQEVRQTAGQLLAKKLELEPDPIEVVPIEAPGEDGMAAGEAPAAGGGAVAAGGISPAPKSRDDAAGRIAAAARFLRAETPTDPAAYLLVRGFRWGEMRARGGAIDPRQLAAPPTEIRTRLKSLLLDAKWPELLEAAEEVTVTAYGRGWLDLQRYVLTACDSLGQEYEHVASSIRGALRSLLRDLPDLVDLTLMDDSPTANRETRAWLRDNGMLDGADEPAEQARSVTPTQGSRRDPFEAAMARVRAGEPQKAIEMLMREANQEKSDRARFLRKSQAASVMVDAGLEPVAIPILEEMLEQIEKHSLEEWEAGDTVAEPLGLMYRCLKKMDGDESTAESLYLRVCRLDPMQAIHFRKPNDVDAGE